MGSGENSDQFTFALQRNGNFGARTWLARHVVGVAGDIGSVVHFARDRDVSDHSFTHWNAMAPAMKGASPNAGKNEFILLRVLEIKVDLHAAERGCTLVDDPRDKLFDVESGGNALREFLQANQFRELQGGRFRRRERGKA